MATTKQCNMCNVIKEKTEFEASRGCCKECRKTKRNDAVKKAPEVDRSLVPLPKACDKCKKGAAFVEFKWRSDHVAGGWRSQCNECFNKKKYYETCRVKERAKDETAYLARNAKSHLKWAHANSVKEQGLLCTTMPERKIKTIKTSADIRNIEFIEADTEPMKEKLKLPCNYCFYKPIDGESLNGLDRVDSNGPYNDINTVPACAICNAMKGFGNIHVFIDKIRQIKKYNKLKCTGERNKMLKFGGQHERRDAPEKDKNVDNLSREYKIKMWAGSCYICGQSPAFGIDRIDANKGYTEDNTASCCSTCNYMKKDLVHSDYLKQVRLIYDHTKTLEIEDVSNMPFLHITGKIRKPVKNNEYGIVFPSSGCVKTIFGINTFEKMKGTWSVVEPWEYRAQKRTDLAEVMKIIG